MCPLKEQTTAFFAPNTMDNEYQIKIVRSLAEIAPKAWDSCANPVSPSAHGVQTDAPKARRAANPFLSHDFLSALEESGSVGAQAGWLPQHILLFDKAGQLAGAMPCYLKVHSRGEYVFDHAWAHAYQRYGLPYYPKLQAAVPFTPVTGPRMLVPPGKDRARRRQLLLQTVIERVHRENLSSFHMTFASHEDWREAGAAGLIQRKDQQFHWHNHDFTHFDDFLASLASRKRKAVRRERRAVLCRDIHVEHITGRDITEAHWDHFFAFYMDTGNRKWGTPYLNRQFFSLIGQSMANQILLIFARRHGKYIAGALNFIGQDTLYGRYWGALEHHPFLHFEICYYQAIDYAIAHRLNRVEAGAQGEHKLARGYLPTPTYSAHYFADPGFAQAVRRYVEEEHHAVDDEIDYYLSHSPFRKDST